jgi:hypothetical protein
VSRRSIRAPHARGGRPWASLPAPLVLRCGIRVPPRRHRGRSPLRSCIEPPSRVPRDDEPVFRSVSRLDQYRFT